MRSIALASFLIVAAANAQVTLIEPPAATGSAEPFLFATGQSVLLSWLEPIANTDRIALRFSRLDAGRWSAARTVVERSDLFANWADFPSIVQDRQGVLFAHWLQRSSASTYAYDVRMATSRDDGRTWSAPFVLNRDGRKTEHGFVSLAALGRGGVAAAWLDGRKMPEGKEEGDMALRYATISASGVIASEVELDARTCECCTSGMAVASSGPVVVYRDRSNDEIRDIAVVRRSSGKWTQPQLVHSDDWKIAGCPVNGPQIDAIGDRVVTAWFTGAGDRGSVLVAFSDDGGATFATPVPVDDGKPLGRVDIVMLDAKRAIVSWIEQTATGAEIRARVVERNLPSHGSIKIAEASTARAAGFPRIASRGRDVYFTWTDQSASSRRIHVARATF
jgi:hypothetical protein